MDISGAYPFNASPPRVWDLLMDPVVLASCIPGCEALEPEGEDRYRARLNVALSAVTGTYDGIVTVSDKEPPTSYRLTIEGQGKAGFVKGSVSVILRPKAATTVVELSGTVEAGGAIARLGQRLIGGVAKMMQDRFFASLQSKV